MGVSGRFRRPHTLLDKSRTTTAGLAELDLGQQWSSRLVATPSSLRTLDRVGISRPPFALAPPGRRTQSLETFRAALQDLKSARNFVDEAATAQPAPHARDERAGKSIA